MGGAIFTYKTNMNNQVQNTDKAYVYNDHLGSVDVVTNAVGTIIIRHSMSFDAWGSRRGGEDWSNWNSLSDSERATAITNALAVPNFSRPITTRGYTGHEMVDDMGIIHMNGRIYDAKLGRFLQADPFIQAATDTQSYNRYSYVRNNPLNATDPSGFIFEKIGKELKRSHRNNIRSLVKVFGADVVNFAGNVASMGCGAWAAVCAANWSYDFARAMGASSKDALRGAAMSAFSSVVFIGIGQSFGGTIKANGFWSWSAQGGAGHIFAHAVAGGVLAEMQGGKFGHGFVSAGLTKAFMSHAGFDVMNGKTSAVIGRTIVAGVVGGTISELTGGKFANGAITAAMAHLFNWEFSRDMRAQAYMQQEHVKWAQANAKVEEFMNEANKFSLEAGAQAGTYRFEVSANLENGVNTQTGFGLGSSSIDLGFDYRLFEWDSDINQYSNLVLSFGGKGPLFGIVGSSLEFSDGKGALVLNVRIIPSKPDVNAAAMVDTHAKYKSN